MPKSKVSVVIPSLNEAAVLPKTIASLLSMLTGWDRDWEIILVDDGSTDGTRAVMETLASKDSRIRWCSYPVNRGRGYALRRGFAMVSGDVVVTAEADLTWGSDVVRRLVESLESGDKDIVLASPYAQGGKLVNVPFHRALVSRVGNRMLAATIPARVSMLSGMTRCYKRDVVDSIEFESDGKVFHLEVLLKALVLGYQIGEIPATLTWEPADAKGVRRRSSTVLRRVVLSHVFLWLLEKPIFLFGFVGAALLLFGLVGGGYITYLRVVGNLNPERPLMTLVVILVLGGFQILAFGFLAMLVGRTRSEVIRLQRLERHILKKLGQ